MPKRILGFTGTRDGLTDAQRRSLKDVVRALDPAKVHHGDCWGADAEFDKICAQRGVHRTAWPGTNAAGESPTRAYCDADIIHRAMPYLRRDRIIAESGVDGLIACPNSPKERMRSGTWATVRMARKLGRGITIINPDGSIVYEESRR